MYNQHNWLDERNSIPDRATAEAAARAREAASTLGQDYVSGQLSAATNQAQASEAAWRLAAEAEAVRRHAWEQAQIQTQPQSGVTRGVSSTSVVAKGLTTTPANVPEKIDKILGGVCVINPPPRKAEQVPPLPKKYQSKSAPSRSSPVPAAGKTTTKSSKTYTLSAWDYVVGFFYLVWIVIRTLPIILVAIWAITLAGYIVVGAIMFIYTIVKIGATGSP